jgi:hypothetical protein
MVSWRRPATTLSRFRIKLSQKLHLGEDMHLGQGGPLTATVTVYLNGVPQGSIQVLLLAPPFSVVVADSTATQETIGIGQSAASLSAAVLDHSPPQEQTTTTLEAVTALSAGATEQTIVHEVVNANLSAVSLSVAVSDQIWLRPPIQWSVVDVVRTTDQVTVSKGTSRTITTLEGLATTELLTVGEPPIVTLTREAQITETIRTQEVVMA